MPFQWKIRRAVSRHVFLASNDGKVRFVCGSVWENTCQAATKLTKGTETISNLTRHTTNGNVSFDIITTVHSIPEARLLSKCFLHTLTLHTNILNPWLIHLFLETRFRQITMFLKTLESIIIDFFGRTRGSSKPGLSLGSFSAMIWVNSCAISTSSFAVAIINQLNSSFDNVATMFKTRSQV